MADSYLKVKDNGASGLALVRQSVDDAQEDLGVADLKTQCIKNIAIPSPQSGYYSGNLGYTITLKSDASSSAYQIDCSEYIGRKVIVKFTNTSSVSSRVTALCNSAGKIGTRYEQRYMTTDGFEFDITSQFNVLYISYANASVSNLQVYTSGDLFNTYESGNAAFVSTTGNDSTGKGTYNAPYATVNKALSEKSRNICLLPGLYEQGIDLTLVSGTVSISNYTETGRVIFRPAESVIATSETAVSGYTKVYSCAISEEINSNIRWIYQDGVADQTTEISDAERLPLQRGMQYRCEDTVITICTANTLSDALAEIENDDTYKWFYDSGTLYFSRPQTVNAQNPICKAIATDFITGITRDNTLILTGIESKYRRFAVRGSVGSVLRDCKSSNVFGAGAFMYNDCTGTVFIRCEASRCQTSSSGDGFNGHATLTGEAHAREMTTMLIDCWAHDNNDDGYSDHERAEVTLSGGLYEYNGKGGVVPSYGSQCNCYNVVCRKNWNGFYLTGVPDEAEGGMYSQCLCVSCVSENNIRGDAHHYGFVCAGANNRMICVGCLSIGNNVGYFAENTASMKLMNCYAAENTTVKSGNVTVQSLEMVS